MIKIGFGKFVYTLYIQIIYNVLHQLFDKLVALRADRRCLAARRLLR